MLDKSRIEYLSRVDPDRYRAALLGTREQKARLLVIYAFHAELAKIPEFVSEPLIGAIRYQWWRDALEEIYAGKPVRQHDIAKPLARVIQECELSRYDMDSLIDGRERDLDPTPFETILEAREYCRETSGRIIGLAAASCVNDGNTDIIADIGTCWGLTGLARSWRFYQNSMLSKLKFKELLDEIESQFLKTQKSLGKISPDLIPAIAYGALIPGYLKAMRKRGYDPVMDAPVYSQLSKKTKLLRTTLTGNI